MTPLRQKMIRELELHRKSPRTVEAYVTAVAQLARHHGRSPDVISIEGVRGFLHHLITERKVAFSTGNQKLAGIRFLYRQVLGQRLMGHATLSTTAKYLHVTSRHLDSIRSPLDLLRLPQEKDAAE